MANKNKFYTKEKEINGVKYVAQFNGMRTATKFIDQCKTEDGNSQSIEKTADFVFENVIVEPKVTIEDFDDLETMSEVVKFGTEVMNGKFRDGEDTTTDKK